MLPCGAAAGVVGRLLLLCQSELCWREPLHTAAHRDARNPPSPPLSELKHTHTVRIVVVLFKKMLTMCFRHFYIHTVNTQWLQCSLCLILCLKQLQVFILMINSEKINKYSDLNIWEHFYRPGKKFTEQMSRLDGHMTHTHTHTGLRGRLLGRHWHLLLWQSKSCDYRAKHYWQGSQTWCLK